MEHQISVSPWRVPHGKMLPVRQTNGSSSSSTSSSSSGRGSPHDRDRGSRRRRSARAGSLLATMLLSCNNLEGAWGLSNQCRTEFDQINDDKIHGIAYKDFWTFCSVRSQNRLATCCETLDLNNMLADGCTDACKTKCLFDDYEEFCEGSQRFSFPRIACTVSRRPMKDQIGDFQLEESFCIPESCNTDADLAGIMEHYHTAGKFEQAMGDYQDAVIVCPSNTAELVMIILIVVFSVGALAALLVYLCRIPAAALETMHSKAVAPEETNFRARELANRIDSNAALSNADGGTELAKQ